MSDWDQISERERRDYSAAWARVSLFQRLSDAFEASGMTKPELAKRAGMKLERVELAVNVPTNMRVETFGRLMFVLTGKPYEF